MSGFLLQLASSFTFADNLSTAAEGRALPLADTHPGFSRQVSNSAPTSTVDIDALVKQQIGVPVEQPDLFHDRRKKDIHNMSRSGEAEADRQLN